MNIYLSGVCFSAIYMLVWVLLCPEAVKKEMPSLSKRPFLVFMVTTILWPTIFAAFIIDMVNRLRIKVVGA